MVVVAIIMMLVALLLPSLQSSKENARSLVCMNNMEQLTKACLIWSNDEDDGKFPCGVCFLSNMYPWWNKPSATGLPADYIPSTSSVVGGEYLPNNPSLFRCPSDDMQTEDTGVGGVLQPTIPRPFSYTSNYTTVGVADPDADPSNMLLPNVTLYGGILLDKGVPNPSHTPFLVEEGKRFNDGYFFAQCSEDTLSERHRGRCHLSFYDGHVETVNARAFNKLGMPERMQYMGPP